jgi:hypothetical protein
MTAIGTNKYKLKWASEKSTPLAIMATLAPQRCRSAW